MITGRSLSTRLLGAAASALATCALLSGCREATTAAAPAKAVQKVTVQLPVARTITDYEQFIGRTQAVETVDVRARVDGYLDQIAFEEGQEVTAGQLLFVIDPRPYEAALARSKAEIDRYNAQLQLADVEFRRADQLLRKSAASKEDFDKAAAARQVSEAGLASARAQVQQDQLNLDFTKVTAPIPGKISRALVTKGNLVIGSVGNPTLLTTIVRMDPMYVYFDVDERSLLRFQSRDREPNANLKAAKIPVALGLSSDEGYPHAGTIDFAENKVDADTGTIQVRAVFENADRLLSPGLFSRIRVESGTPYEALLVPEAAIGTDQGQKFVLVVDDKGEVAYRRVKLGTLTDDNYRVVTDGLAPTDQVIVNGMLRVRPGMKVEAEKTAPPPDAGASLAPAEPTPPAPAPAEPTPPAPAEPAAPAKGEGR